jgi:hypothetical protein
MQPTLSNWQNISVKDGRNMIRPVEPGRASLAHRENYLQNLASHLSKHLAEMVVEEGRS